MSVQNIAYVYWRGNDSKKKGRQRSFREYPRVCSGYQCTPLPLHCKPVAVLCILKQPCIKVCFFFSLRWAWFVCLRAYFICHNFVLDQLPDAEPVELSRHHQETLFLVVELVQLDQSTWQLPPQTDTCIFCASYAKANGLLVKLYVKETKASWVYA